MPKEFSTRSRPATAEDAEVILAHLPRLRKRDCRSGAEALKSCFPAGFADRTRLYEAPSLTDEAVKRAFCSDLLHGAENLSLGVSFTQLLLGARHAFLLGDGSFGSQTSTNWSIAAHAEGDVLQAASLCKSGSEGGHPDTLASSDLQLPACASTAMLGTQIEPSGSDGAAASTQQLASASAEGTTTGETQQRQQTSDVVIAKPLHARRRLHTRPQQPAHGNSSSACHISESTPHAAGMAWPLPSRGSPVQRFRVPAPDAQSAGSTAGCLATIRRHPSTFSSCGNGSSAHRPSTAGTGLSEVTGSDDGGSDHGRGTVPESHDVCSGVEAYLQLLRGGYRVVLDVVPLQALAATQDGTALAALQRTAQHIHIGFRDSLQQVRELVARHNLWSSDTDDEDPEGVKHLKGRSEEAHDLHLSYYDAASER